MNNCKECYYNKLYMQAVKEIELLRHKVDELERINKNLKILELSHKNINNDSVEDWGQTFR